MNHSSSNDMDSFRSRFRQLLMKAAGGVFAFMGMLVFSILPLGHAVTAKAAGVACVPGTTVQTTTGPVCGFVDNGDAAWLGIPYAAPPVGNLRWQPPQPHDPWTDTLQATSAASECLQGSATHPAGSEDCLYLNVVQPSGTTASSGRPVVVHIHGGGFSGGNSDGALVLPNNGDVYVSINYRLGIMGFLSDPALGAHSGDYGLQDQEAALRWVHDNIAAFGGDSGNVTIEGESAGGSSVCHLIASPTAAGLFQKAISVSGEYNPLFNTPDSGFNDELQDCKAALPTQAQAGQFGEDFAAAAGCSTAPDVAECLRSLPIPQALSAAGAGYQHGGHGTIAPTINGATLTQTLRQALKTGDVNRVPVIAGTSRDENLAGLPTTEAQYQQLVQAEYGSLAPKVLAEYPASNFVDPFVAWRTVAADSNGVCSALETDRDLARWMPVYGYEVDDGNAATGRAGVPAGEPGGSWHVVDWYLTEGAAKNPNQAAVFSQEIASVTTFASGGQPHGANTPPWPSFAVGDGAASIMVFAPGADSQAMPIKAIEAVHNCDFWDKVAPQP